MLQSIKRLTKHTLIYGIGHIMGRMIGFLLLPIHTSTLSVSDYGVSALLFSSLAILNVIFSYGMDVAFLRFFILQKDKIKQQEIFSTAFLMILMTGLIFSGFLIWQKEWVSLIIFQSTRFSDLILLASGILLTDALVLVPFLVLRAQEKSTTFIVIKTLNIILNLGLNIVFLFVLNLGVKGIFIANLIASLCSLLMLMPVVVSWLKMKFSSAWLKELLAFGLPYIPSGLALLIMEQIGRFFLDRMVDREAAGLFSAAYKLGMFMALLVAAFRFAWQPFFLSLADKPEAPNVYSRVFTYFMMVAGLVFLCITFFLPEIISIRLFGVWLFKADYAAGVVIVPFILLAYIGYGAYVNFIVGVYIKKKTGYLPLVTAAGAIVSLIANSLFISRFGIQGAAASVMIAYWSMAVVLYFINQRIFPVGYEWTRLIKLICAIVILYLFQLYLPWRDLFIVRLFILMLLPVVLWVIQFFNAEEKNAFKIKLS